ncbi:MAG: four-carbon acid sugar kinase family protein [Terracidiphilus sp.]|nr:four-carbon acid sugar kinase family protein [Terracidiphilus sp.]
MTRSTAQFVQTGTSVRGVTGVQKKQAGGFPSVLLIADDLTGACDSGLAFAKEGYAVTVRWSQPGEVAGTEAGVLAISADTRNLRPGEAGSRVRDFKCLREFGGSVLFHKVDSAGRGNPGEELLAIMEICGCEAVVYTPAFPSAGRRVRNARLEVSDFSGQRDGFDLMHSIPKPEQKRVCILPASDADELRRGMIQARERGKDIWLCDAETQEDLKQIAAVAAELPMRLLWSGSAGLAAAVAGKLGKCERAGVPENVRLPAAGRTLAVVGTDHPVTVEQTRRLVEQATELVMGDEVPVPNFGCGVVVVDWSRMDRASLRSFWMRLHVGEQPKVDSLVLTGGDTAAFVLDALEAEALDLRGEVEPGIPWSVMRGGWADGCVALTKSGGFGNEDSLVGMVEFCRRMRI